VGALSLIPLAMGSFHAGALCLLCLCTYVLVLAFAFFAFAWLPGPLALSEGELGKGLLWSGAVAVIAYLVALGPGLATPHAQSATLPANVVTDLGTSADPGSAAQAQASDGSPLAQFLSRLPPDQKQAVADSLALWRQGMVRAQEGHFAPAAHTGAANAPVKMVEFTDIACPHCAHLMEAMKQLRQLVPPQQMSVESRYFPLDAECNPTLPPQATDHTGLRCLGAKVQICLEKAPDFLSLRDALFDAQQGLTPEKVMQIASSGSVSREKLEACVKSPETAQRLQQDIQFAMAYDIQGTPLVLINGKEGTPVPAFLLAMALAGGNGNAPAFAALPQPQLSDFGQ
jgi:serine/threonine-protein kinase